MVCTITGIIEENYHNHFETSNQNQLPNIMSQLKHKDQAETFMLKFCSTLNSLHTDEHDGDFDEWTKKQLESIFSDDVVLKFGNMKVGGSGGMYNIFGQFQEAFKLRSSVATLWNFTDVGVSFTEDVTYTPWTDSKMKYQEVKLTYTWQLTVNADGKVSKGSCKSTKALNHSLALHFVPRDGTKTLRKVEQSED